MGGNRRTQRKPTTFGRVLTNSSHVRSEARYRNRTRDLSGGRTSLRRLSHRRANYRIPTVIFKIISSISRRVQNIPKRLKPPKPIYHRLGGVELIMAFEVPDWPDKIYKCLLLEDFGVLITFIWTRWIIGCRKHSQQGRQKHSRSKGTYHHKWRSNSNMKFSVLYHHVFLMFIFLEMIAFIVLDSASASKKKSKSQTKDEVSF